MLCRLCPWPFVLALLSLTTLVPTGWADAPLSLEEHFAPGTLHRVSVRVELAGTLTLPPAKAETAGKVLKVSGKSAIDYEERVLSVAARGQVDRTIRRYLQMDFERKVGEQVQQGQLRPAVQRLVILRHQQMEVPFSPDGPLTWGEIDLVRTDVFTPALVGLLPERPVRLEERWSAATTAIQELTDFEEISEGALICRLEQEVTLAGRKHLRISFRGTITGVGQDGRSRQELDGYFYFDLAAQSISYLSMRGVHSLLEKDGSVGGQVEGTFVLTRQPLQSASGLSDDALRRLKLEPDDTNTLLLYDNPVLGLRFLHPRRWHVAGMKGTQLGLDEKGGSGILLTVEPLTHLPTGAQFLQESQQWLKQQKAVVQRVEPLRTIRQAPLIESFALDVAVSGQQFRMYYFVVRQESGGVVVAARLLPQELAQLQREVLALTESLQVRRKMP